MLSITAAALALYVYAPQAKDALPQVAQPIDGYVTFVDMARGKLDEGLSAFSQTANSWMEKATASVNGAATRDTPALPAEPDAG